MFDLAAAARSESLSWNPAWGRGSPRATGEGGQRPWSAAGAGRTRAAQGGCRLLAGVGEGFPVVLSEMATAAGNAPGAQPGWGKPGLHRSIKKKKKRLFKLNSQEMMWRVVHYKVQF